MITFAVVVASAALVAFTLGYVARYDIGLSRIEIRRSALIATALIVTLLATELFRRYWRKPINGHRQTGPVGRVGANNGNGSTLSIVGASDVHKRQVPN